MHWMMRMGRSVTLKFRFISRLKAYVWNLVRQYSANNTRKSSKPWTVKQAKSEIWKNGIWRTVYGEHVCNYYAIWLHRMWVWCSSRYIFSDYLPETWKPGVLYKFKEQNGFVWIVATLEWPPVWFLFAYKWTCYWRPSVSLSIWLWSTVQPSIHSCPGELEQTLTMQLPKHWDILKAADSENRRRHLCWKPSQNACPTEWEKFRAQQLEKAWFGKLRNTLDSTIQIFFLHVWSIYKDNMQ